MNSEVSILIHGILTGGGDLFKATKKKKKKKKKNLLNYNYKKHQ